mmetsp:Transcript_24985/g.49901  ORF Transcript_24985/g.49901 Transcript_24985/m.49901 type:complete len:84 (+) Transcript_24985:940-1191(+)
MIRRKEYRSGNGRGNGIRRRKGIRRRRKRKIGAEDYYVHEVPSEKGEMSFAMRSSAYYEDENVDDLHDNDRYGALALQFLARH